MKKSKKYKYKTNNNFVFRSFTLLVAINNKECIGKSFYEKGGTTKEIMVEFIETQIAPKYKNHLIILDNARSHNNDVVREAIIKSGNQYLFTIPYSPITNQLFRVHRLVCEVFNGKAPENKNIVDHINRIRDDNKAKNLRWVTHKENMNNKTEPNLNKNKEIRNKYLLLDKKNEAFKMILNSNYGNFENYSVSNYGRIKNNKTNKILKPKITDEGYMNISLINKENKLNIPIHRLVCEYFNEKTYDNDNVVNHINEIKHDNYYKNLEWVSIKKIINIQKIF